jgi:hypothetical protein
MLACDFFRIDCAVTLRRLYVGARAAGVFIVAFGAPIVQF